jgi:hypothetical protein
MHLARQHSIKSTRYGCRYTSSTTELTIHGTKGASTSTSFPWDNFYYMVLSNAKLLDSNRSKQTGRHQETNQANQNNASYGSNRNNRSGRNANSKTCVAYTGPNMVMEPGMRLALLIG